VRVLQGNSPSRQTPDALRRVRTSDNLVLQQCAAQQLHSDRQFTDELLTGCGGHHESSINGSAATTSVNCKSVRSCTFPTVSRLCPWPDVRLILRREAANPAELVEHGYPLDSDDAPPATLVGDDSLAVRSASRAAVSSWAGICRKPQGLAACEPCPAPINPSTDFTGGCEYLRHAHPSRSHAPTSTVSSTTFEKAIGLCDGSHAKNRLVRAILNRASSEEDEPNERTSINALVRRPT
jgi:hypothetical protein